MARFPFTKSLLLAVKCLTNGSPTGSRCITTGAVQNLMSKQLVYSEFGDPLHVVKFRECTVPPLASQEVLVRMLAAPVNPADINTIQGKYPVKVNLPSIAGNEGVGVVESTGSEVKGLCPGNKVIITKPVQGTWRNIGVFDQSVLKAVPNDLGIAEAATLSVNPCTAYRMLTDFKPVREKQLVVIQNGANSACGQNVIQICKAWGIKNVNIVRQRPDILELKKYLECLGATVVLTEEELRKTSIFKDGQIDRPSLALNCVGGKNSLEMLRHLTHSGCMVTYGGMSREPVMIPTSAFIFKNLSFHGFWMTAWNKQSDEVMQNKMLSELVELMCAGQLRAPVHKMVKFSQYEEAIKNALNMQGFTGVVPGDRVVLTSRLLGSWRYYGIYNERDVHIVSPNIPLPEASMLTIAPCMAYRMIKDFRHVYPGQTIVQNAANSPCGQSVIQLCKYWGINTLNIVANHCGYDSVKQHLLSIGATAVCTIEEAEELCLFNTSLTRPVLALNCLGGRFEDVMLQLLERNGTIVYYGCAYDLPMAKQFLRSDLIFRRFHLSDWDAQATCVTKDVMLNDIIRLMAIGKFIAPMYVPVELKNYVQAFRNTTHCEAFCTTSYITLTDAQYNVLEQKGWILLEFSGRIFVLDTLGLHDITTDENIPDKIFLGRTVNGKKLYAKVTKSKHKEITNMELAKCAKSFEKDKNFDAIDDDHFISIIEEYIREPPARVQVNEVVAAVTLLTQLMRIAHIKDTVMGKCVVITKTVIFVTADGKEKTRREPTAMTGEVKPVR
ncbi:putative zinc binding dehydrogenase [Operophtera brumata]|uniref:Enoyl-[acyl-carrier-protein] reductase, mitochondrial n=1 Tax=Operophtera brumata TaxID=104452 RepID=A0A0L7L340_OPEBR|nr:putative zinc binding dehydrogenase [Operophtera brumata]